MLPLTDLTKELAVTFREDEASDEQKTVFYVRTLTLRERNHIDLLLAASNTTHAAYAHEVVLNTLSYFLARIERAKRTVEYEELELCGRRLHCVSRKWIDENLPLGVVIGLFNEVLKMRGLGSEQLLQSAAQAHQQSSASLT